MKILFQKIREGKGEGKRASYLSPWKTPGRARVADVGEGPEERQLPATGGVGLPATGGEGSCRQPSRKGRRRALDAQTARPREHERSER